MGRNGNGHEVHNDFYAIETRGLRKAFGRNEILRGTDLTIPEGAITTVIGPSGTGKSVLIKHVIGLLKPDAGEVFVHGHALGPMTRAELLELRRGIGIMFQDGALFSSMDVYDNCAFPLRQHTDLGENHVRDIVEEQLEAVGLLDYQTRFPRELSGGMKKRAGLARSLVLDPGIVMCDEPDSGLDPVRTALLGELLVARQRDIGGTMVVVTHNMPLAELISDYIAVLYRGEIIEAGPADQVRNSESDFVRQFIAGATAGPLSMEA